LKIDYGTTAFFTAFAQGGCGINNLVSDGRVCVYAELLASILQAKSEICEMRK
jgi:hypothetical protein